MYQPISQSSLFQ